VLFNLVVKHSRQKKSKQREKKQGKNSGFEPTPRTHAFITCTTSTRINKGAENLKNGFLLFCLVAFFVHASIFCPRFSQKQSAKRPKNTGKCFTTKLKSTCKNSGTFVKEKKFTRKSHLC